MTEAWRALAFRPFLEVHRPADWVAIAGPGVDVVVHRLPIAKVAIPRPELVDVPAAVAAVRQVARTHNVSALIWLIPPEQDHLGKDLEREGLVNGALPGFEPVETAMVLDHAPTGARAANIHVAAVASIEDARAAAVVMERSFEMPVGQLSAAVEPMWSHAQDPAYPIRQYVARLDGEVVGTAVAATAPGGVNLFGGSVLASARGRGVYKAMIAHRWRLAVERNTPALTVQAGRMSQPVLEHAGFRVLGQMRVYADPYIT